MALTKSGHCYQHGAWYVLEHALQLQSMLLLIEDDRQVTAVSLHGKCPRVWLCLGSGVAVHGEKCLKIPDRRHESYCSQRAAQYRIHKWALNAPSFQILACDQVKRQPQKPQFPTRLRKFCLSEVSHLWDRCQRWSTARISSGCSSDLTCHPALVSSGATKSAAEQEISALPLAPEVINQLHLSVLALSALLTGFYSQV